MTEKMIRDAYCRIRTIDQTIPDDVLDFMKDAALEKLRKHAVMSSSSLKNPPPPPPDRILREDGKGLVPPKNYR